MKLWITTRNLPNSTNCDRAIPSHTLLPKHRHRLQKSKTYLPRRKLRLTPTNTTRQRSIPILRLHLPTYRTKHILWIIQLHTHMVCRSSNPIPNHSNSVYRLRTTMRTNIILRCNSNYKPTISHPLCRKGGSPMSMRGICSRQCHTHAILRPTLPNTIRNRSNSLNPSTFPSPNRIKQSPRTKQKHRQNPVPPILHSKGHFWIRPNNHSTNCTNTKGTIHPKRPRQLHTSKSPRNTRPHSARMILLICICNPTFNPQQTRRSNCPSHINRNPIYHTNQQIKVSRNTILPNQPNPILNNNKHCDPTNMNWSTTSRRSLHSNRTNSNNDILHILCNKPHNNKAMR